MILLRNLVLAVVVVFPRPLFFCGTFLAGPHWAAGKRVPRPKGSSRNQILPEEHGSAKAAAPKGGGCRLFTAAGGKEGGCTWLTSPVGLATGSICSQEPGAGRGARAPRGPRRGNARGGTPFGPAIRLVLGTPKDWGFISNPSAHRRLGERDKPGGGRPRVIRGENRQFSAKIPGKKKARRRSLVGKLSAPGKEMGARRIDWVGGERLQRAGGRGPHTAK